MLPFRGKAGEHYLGSIPGTKPRWLVNECILDYGVP